MRFFLFPFILLIVTISCNADKELQLITGKGLDPERHTIREKRTTFKPGEPFAILVTGIKLKDSRLKLTIHSIAKDGKEILSRTIKLNKIDTALDYLQIPDHFSIPFAGKYRISFSQLKRRIATTIVTIKE